MVIMRRAASKANGAHREVHGCSALDPEATVPAMLLRSGHRGFKMALPRTDIFQPENECEVYILWCRVAVLPA